MGARLYNLLKALLFQVKFSIVQDTLDDGILDDSVRVSRALKDSERKRKESKYVEEILGEGRNGAMSNSELPLSIFGRSST